MILNIINIYYVIIKDKLNILDKVLKSIKRYKTKLKKKLFEILKCNSINSFFEAFFCSYNYIIGVIGFFFKKYFNNFLV